MLPEGLREIVLAVSEKTSYLYIITDALWCLLMDRRWFSCVAPEIDLAFLPIQSEEAAGDYKDIDEVMANQADLVKTVTALSPVAVIKG
ncbi:MAG: RtcB family protein [Bacteroidales bacterium]|nr:RtcB family protein [Bacteroidales bacterium]